jgi:hypothetical protein
VLEAARDQVQALWTEEDGALEGRSLPSRETGSGRVSEDAAHFLTEARDDIQNAIDQMQLASGDESLPEPAPAPAKPDRRF